MSSGVVPKDEDFEEVLGQRFMCGRDTWAQLKAGATRAAAQRLLRDNIAAQRELAANLGSLTGLPWMAEQERFTELLKQHDELLRIAYPEVNHGR